MATIRMCKQHWHCRSDCQDDASVWRGIALLAGTDRVRLTLGLSQEEIDALLSRGRDDIHFN